MKRLNFFSALRAGIAATLVMTIMTMIAPMMGLPEMNIPGMLAGFLGVPVLVGWLMHFMIGITLAIIYGGILAGRFANARLLDGAIYGLAPWLMAQLAVMPMMGMGLFSGSFMMATGSLIGHMVYGAVLGAVYRPRLIHAEDCEGKRYANKGNAIAL